MAEADVRAQDMEFRRRTLQQAADQVRSLDLGNAPPSYSFSLAGSPLQAATPTVHHAPPLVGDIPGSAGELARRYRARELFPVEVTLRALEEAQAKQATINAFITLLDESALDAARASEERFERGRPLGPLDGIPVGVKDLVDIAGERTTCASKIMADHVATEDAEIITRLRAAGAIIIGKTNLHEFAYGGTGDISFFGPARNPHNIEHITGGSSSGSGAAVAAGICPVAIGTDTACSIRTPAALCGIVGLKPTYGRVSTRGVMPLSWSQDHIGPMTACVEDAGLTLAVLSDFEAPDLSGIGNGKFRLGVCREIFWERLDPDVRRLVESAVALLGEIREVTIPHIGLAGAAQAMITSSEAGAVHRHWLETRREDYDWGVSNRLMASLEVSGHDAVQGSRVRSLIVDEMRAAMVDVDVLAMPMVPIPAPKFGQREAQLEGGISEPVIPLMLRNASPMNVTGFPAISVPCGTAPNGLPVGLQLVGRPWEEGRLLQVARAFEARFRSN